MTKLRVVINPVKKELRLKRCGFDHDTPDDFVKSQWQTCTKSMAYLFYRWFVALFFIVVVIVSMWPEADDETSYWLYFIYMTNWGIWMCMLTNLLGAILVTVWHYHSEYADKLLNMQRWKSPFRIYWSMHIISLVLSIVITIIYWSVLYNSYKDPLDATNVLTHGFNSIFMFIDLWIVAHPLRLLHVFLPVLFGSIYAIFSLIYQMCGGINKKGKPYIYHVINWSQPFNACITVVGVLVLSCCVYVLLFVFFKLRLFLSHSFRQEGIVLPNTSEQASKSVEGTMPAPSGIQHSPSRISMVLGNFSSYENQAFALSSG